MEIVSYHFEILGFFLSSVGQIKVVNQSQILEPFIGGKLVSCLSIAFSFNKKKANIKSKILTKGKAYIFLSFLLS